LTFSTTRFVHHAPFIAREPCLFAESVAPLA
jgi:hypothetical protein